MSAAPAKAAEKLIATNPARSDFFLEEVVEAGVALTGTEVKSLRAASPNLRDSFVEVLAGKPETLEAWLVNLHIGPYTHGNIWNHEPRRRRKLLLHRHQIDKLYGAIIKKGMTVVPTRMYFLKGRVKIEVALARGKKKHDKRETLKKKSAEYDMDQARKQSRK